jgi:type IV secretory pathway VirB2 component (pilin)
MIRIATIQETSLSDPSPDSAIATAAAWVSNLLFGPLAMSIAVIAIAAIGFAMLSGRIDIRRGLSVVLGCFLLFGAKGIADGLRSAAVDDAGNPIATVPPPPSFPAAVRAANGTNAFDPYAGAAVMPAQQ